MRQAYRVSGSGTPVFLTRVGLGLGGWGGVLFISFYILIPLDRSGDGILYLAVLKRGLTLVNGRVNKSEGWRGGRR